MQIVVLKRLVVHSRDEALGHRYVMLDVLSQRRIASGLESIVGVGCGDWSDVGLQAVPVHNVNALLKQAGDIFFDTDILVNTDRRIGIDLDHDVGVAVGPVVAAGTRTEQRRVAA